MFCSNGAPRYSFMSMRLSGHLMPYGDRLQTAFDLAFTQASAGAAQLGNTSGGAISQLADWLFGSKKSDTAGRLSGVSDIPQSSTFDKTSTNYNDVIVYCAMTIFNSQPRGSRYWHVDGQAYIDDADGVDACITGFPAPGALYPPRTMVINNALRRYLDAIIICPSYLTWLATTVINTFILRGKHETTLAKSREIG